MKPVCSISGVTNIFNTTISDSHGSATPTAIIEAKSTTLTIGDFTEIYLGYSDTGIGKLFSGYVKQIEKKIPSNTYILTLNGNLIRAMDNFLVSANPATPLSYQNIQAESLVQDLMSKSGLTSYTYDTTYFTVAPSEPIEVSLISAYDYAKTLADILTWAIWGDENGLIHFESRKPYVMTGTSGLVGDKVDVPISYTAIDSNILEINYNTNEKNLRNRIVVYGISNDIYAEAKVSSPYLPSGFYKTAVIAAGPMIATVAAAQDCANKNLYVLNRLTKGISLSVVGNKILKARQVIQVNSSKLGITGNWYIYSCNHNYSKEGYITQLELRE